jgi:hypothetical protein
MNNPNLNKSSRDPPRIPNSGQRASLVPLTGYFQVNGHDLSVTTEHESLSVNETFR